MIDTKVQKRIEEHWGNEFGCPIGILDAPGSKVLVRHDDAGAFVFRYRETCIWHVPKRFESHVVRQLEAQASVDQVFQEAFINELFGSAVRLVLGPCPIAYCDKEMLRTDGRLPPCRRLGKTDKTVVEHLAITCGVDAWEHGGVELEGHKAVFGCFTENQLVAAASYEIWGDSIAHVGVATAPSFRGRGFAKAVATAATDDALREGLVPQWRTLASNLASVSVGRAIGYMPTAAHFYVRLASE